jgi:hypothetical protein
MASYDPLLKTIGRLNYKSEYKTDYRNRGSHLTDSQKDLIPYIQQEKEKTEKKRGLLQPLEFVLDLMQRGQYLTANVAEQIARNVEEGKPLFDGVPREAWEGIIGKQKGDWEKVLFGGATPGGEEYRGIVRALGGDPEKMPKWSKSILGFAANVVLDPTTYIGFGPAKAARSAATKYADDVVRLTFREMGEGLAKKLPEAAQRGFDASKLSDLLAKSPQQATEYATKYFGDDFARRMNDTYKAARKEGLRKPAAELEQQITGRAAALKDQATENLSSRLAGQGAGLDEFYSALESSVSPIDAIASGAKYGGAGQRSMRLFGKEVARGERYPAMVKGWDEVAKRFKDSKIGGLFADAWWAHIERPESAVGRLRKMFGFRNPYQTFLNTRLRDVEAQFNQGAWERSQKALQAIGDASDEEMRKATELLIGAQDMPLRQSESWAKLSPKEQERLGDVTENIKQLMDDWRKEYQNWQDVFPNGIGYIENYIPIFQKRTGFKRAGRLAGPTLPGFAKEREIAFGEHISNQTEKIKFLLGVSDEEAQKLVMNGLSDVETDLKKMLVGRAIAQARAEHRVNMVRQFKEFGISASELPPAIMQGIGGKGGQIEAMGLTSVADPALEGMLFDRDVADIFTRATKISQSDESLRNFERMMNTFTGWWKAWAVMSPGFHARNFLSNNVTGVLKDGARWFDPNTSMEALAATSLGLLGPEKAIAAMKKSGLPEDTIKALLSRRYGDYSLEELGKLATQKGVISRATMGFDIPSTIEELSGKKGIDLNPFSMNFSPFKASRAAGTWIESVPRMQSFLLDYKELVKSGNTSAAALDYAKNEAKKWFLDYGDLSEFEKKVMKNVVPFYSWLRKNIANQLTGMMQFRDMYPLIAKGEDLMQSMGGMDETDRQNLPDWMRQLGIIPVGRDDDGGVKTFWPNIPIGDLNRIPLMFEVGDSGLPIPKLQPREAIDDMISSAHPALKTAIELIPQPGWDVFLKREIKDQEAAPRLIRVLSKSPQVLTFLDGTMRAAGFEEGLRASMDEKGRLLIDGKMAKFLKNNVPLLESIPKWLDLPEQIVPAIEDWKRNLTGAVDDYTALEELFQTMSFYGGLKFKKYSPEEEEQRRAQDVLAMAEREQAKARKLGPGYQRRKLEYISKRREKARKLGA